MRPEKSVELEGQGISDYSWSIWKTVGNKLEEILFVAYSWF